MATVDITIWDEKNTASVGTLSDSSSFTGLQKVQVIKVTEGTGSGTGDAQFSSSTWNNISSNNDIVVTESDESTTRAYEIQELNTTNNVAWIWVYGSWDSDDSDQVVIGAGTGDGTDYSVDGVGDNPWEQSGVNAGAAWLFQETSGSYVDSTANNNDSATENVTSRTASGQFGNAPEFDGTDDEVKVTHDSTINPSSDGDLTVVGFAKASSINDWATVAEKRNTNDSQGWTLDFDNNDSSFNGNEFYCEIWDGSDKLAKASSTTQSTGTWFHLGMVVDTANDSLNIVVDGSYDNGSSRTTGTFSWSDGISYSNDDLFIGEDDEFGEQHTGEVDALRIYPGESKSENWIQADYDASPEGGQVFFSWSGPTTTGTEKSVTTTHDAAIIHRQNGVVDLDGSTVQGAEVDVYNITQGKNIGHDTTDSNGNYSIDPSNVGDIASGDKLMISVYYEQGDGDDFGQVKVTVV